MNPWRLVRLVVVDGTGTPLGITEQRRVEMPWWQEVGPVRDAFPGAVVLRMLEVRPEPGQRAGGHVTYVAEFEGEPPALSPWPSPEPSPWRAPQPSSRPSPRPSPLDEHPLRMPWARPGGPARDLAWVDSVVASTGGGRARSAIPTSGGKRTESAAATSRGAQQHRTWNLSAVWSVSSGDTRVWLKCVAPFFAHEAAVLRVLADQPVPDLVAADAHRLLLAEMDGVDGYEADDEQRRRFIDTLLGIQLAAVDRVDELLARGVPDRRWAPLTRELAGVVARRAPDDERLTAFIAGLDERFAAVDACGLPFTLVHGDAHSGNSRIACAQPTVFDWGDSYVGHPLLDLGVVGDDAAGAPLAAYWLDRWEKRVPGSDPHRAWELLRPVAALRGAWVYQTFLDFIEPSEYPYHENDLQPAIDRAAGMLG